MALIEITSNFPIALMRGLRDTFCLEQFVETGTCRGNTALLAALAFPRVYTIELSDEKHAIAADRLRGLSNVSLWHGHSTDLLVGMEWRNEPPTLIYLDAHWPDEGGDEKTNRPLRDELATIGGLFRKHVLVADDVLSPAVKDHIADWGCFVNDVDKGDVLFTVLTPHSCVLKGWV